jgi:xanthine/uracil permease
MWLVRYFALLPPSRLILWSYVIWWLFMVTYYFSSDPRLWAMSLGIGLIVGFALMLCTGPVTLDRFRKRFWESLRLFVCPFMVSSFSAAVTGKNFILVFSPNWEENAAAVTGIILFLLLTRMLNITVLRGEQ